MSQEFNESSELISSLKRIASLQQCSPLLQWQHYHSRNVQKKTFPAALTMRGGGKYGHKYSIRCFNSTDWFCLRWAEPQESVQCRRVQM